MTNHKTINQLINDAVSSGDVAFIQTLLDRGLSPDTLIYDDWGTDATTFLHFAAENGQKELVQLLISNNAMIDLQASDQSTPFYDAVFYGHEEIAEILLDAGADINAISDSESRTSALHQAVLQGYASLVKKILLRGANYNLVDGDEETPLEIAAKDTKIDIINYFLLYTDLGLNFKKLPGNVQKIIPEDEKDKAEIMIPFATDTYQYITTWDMLKQLANLENLLEKNLSSNHAKSLQNNVDILLATLERLQIDISYEKRKLLQEVKENMAALSDAKRGRLSLFWQSAKSLAKKDITPQEDEILNKICPDEIREAIALIQLNKF